MSDPLSAVIAGFRVYRELVDLGFLVDHWKWLTLDQFVEAGWTRDPTDHDHLLNGDMWIDIPGRGFGAGSQAVWAERATFSQDVLRMPADASDWGGDRQD